MRLKMSINFSMVKCAQLEPEPKPEPEPELQPESELELDFEHDTTRRYPRQGKTGTEKTAN